MRKTSEQVRRRVVQLREQRLTYPQIAHRLGISVLTAKRVYKEMSQSNDAQRNCKPVG